MNNQTNEKLKYDEIPKDAGKNVHPDVAAKRQKYVVTIEKEKQSIQFLPEDTMFITAEQLPHCVSWYMPGYSLRKSSSLERFFRKWYFKYRIPIPT